MEKQKGKNQYFPICIPRPERFGRLSTDIGSFMGILSSWPRECLPSHPILLKMLYPTPAVPTTVVGNSIPDKLSISSLSSYSKFC